MTRVCVFCASSTRLDEQWLKLGYAVGLGLGRAGHEVISGGGRVGLMGAVAEGARAGGANTVGVIPQALLDLEVADTAADELVVTDGMAARKIVMLERADVFLVLPGGLGTLDELFEVWTTATLGLHNKPVILFDAEGFYAGLLAWLERLVADGFISDKGMATVHVVRTVDEALDSVQRFR
jgi:uncharacterized protein (TIGR00730 family)